MVRLKFHYELYSAAAIDETIEVFQEHAGIERRQGVSHYEVDIEAVDRDAEEQLAGEFANFALALTVEERRSGGSG